VIISYDVEAEQNIFCMFSLREPTQKPLLSEEYCIHPSKATLFTDLIAC